MYAIIADGRVIAVTEDEPAPGLMFMDCPAEIQVSWLLDGGVCVAPPAPPPPDPNAVIDAQIQALEDSVTQRRLREAALTEPGRMWLADVDARITALRAQRVKS